ncbi:low affinity immunoglobulin gamma Fc region receptor II-like isoform X2 [Bufo gargarizans]|uniref:low affinity immunoglobulin gamma Fc region receptor II-like isoform X2 n=1 Tax=Bufo gargarizans TaxID=30331 RepID=UPI001CF4951A|nr:low affinity immunoglobulin gamma Fc region receptor II-like isoform X2 [Bufo gargarizans]
MIYCASVDRTKCTMRAQIIILIISATTEHCGAEVKPVVTFTPKWRIIFPYESVTISCNVGSTTQGNLRYYWSKDGKALSQSHHQRAIKIESASDENTGSYQCWVKAELKSDAVRLEVVGTPLILQTPSVVYVGEPLTLRCHSFFSYKKTNTTFYKNKTAIHFSVNDTELRFTSVDWNVAGSYSCSQKILLHETYKTFNATATVSVQEPLRKCGSEEDDVCYTYIGMNHVQTALPAQQPDDDYSIVYSLVTPAVGTVE